MSNKRLFPTWDIVTMGAVHGRLGDLELTAINTRRHSWGFEIWEFKVIDSQGEVLRQFENKCVAQISGASEARAILAEAAVYAYREVQR